MYSRISLPLDFIEPDVDLSATLVNGQAVLATTTKTQPKSECVMTAALESCESDLDSEEADVDLSSALVNGQAVLVKRSPVQLSELETSVKHQAPKLPSKPRSKAKIPNRHSANRKLDFDQNLAN